MFHERLSAWAIDVDSKRNSLVGIVLHTAVGGGGSHLSEVGCDPKFPALEWGLRLVQYCTQLGYSPASTLYRVKAPLSFTPTQSNIGSKECCGGRS